MFKMKNNMGQNWGFCCKFHYSKFSSYSVTLIAHFAKLTLQFNLPWDLDLDLVAMPLILFC